MCLLPTILISKRAHFACQIVCVEIITSSQGGLENIAHNIPAFFFLLQAEGAGGGDGFFLVLSWRGRVGEQPGGAGGRVRCVVM